MQTLTKKYHRALKSQDSSSGRDSTHWAELGWSSKESVPSTAVGLEWGVLGATRLRAQPVSPQPHLGMDTLTKTPPHFPKATIVYPLLRAQDLHTHGLFWAFPKSVLPAGWAHGARAVPLTPDQLGTPGEGKSPSEAQCWSGMHTSLMVSHLTWDPTSALPDT